MNVEYYLCLLLSEWHVLLFINAIICITKFPVSAIFVISNKPNIIIVGIVY